MLKFGILKFGMLKLGILKFDDGLLIPNLFTKVSSFNIWLNDFVKESIKNDPPLSFIIESLFFILSDRFLNVSNVSFERNENDSESLSAIISVINLAGSVNKLINLLIAGISLENILTNNFINGMKAPTACGNLYHELLFSPLIFFLFLLVSSLSSILDPSII